MPPKVGLDALLINGDENCDKRSGTIPGALSRGNIDQ